MGKIDDLGELDGASQTSKARRRSLRDHEPIIQVSVELNQLQTLIRLIVVIIILMPYKEFRFRLARFDSPPNQGYLRE
ncbi:MAG: hypothetical protein ACXAB4_12660 [Candidatus Hodarchaeales archaeon]|jgi:hypothetical protein